MLAGVGMLPVLLLLAFSVVLGVIGMVSFQTDAAAVAGMGAELLSGETFFISPGMHITDIFQTPGAAILNDADWTLTIDGIATRFAWTAEELDPVAFAAAGGRLPTPISVRPGALVQMAWANQAVAQANIVKLLYQTG